MQRDELTTPQPGITEMAVSFRDNYTSLAVDAYLETMMYGLKDDQGKQAMCDRLEPIYYRHLAELHRNRTDELWLTQWIEQRMEFYAERVAFLDIEFTPRPVVQQIVEDTLEPQLEGLRAFMRHPLASIIRVLTGDPLPVDQRRMLNDLRSLSERYGDKGKEAPDKDRSGGFMSF